MIQYASIQQLHLIIKLFAGVRLFPKDTQPHCNVLFSYHLGIILYIIIIAIRISELNTGKREWVIIVQFIVYVIDHGVKNKLKPI